MTNATLHSDGERGRDLGIGRAMNAAPDQWKADMLECIRMCAQTNKRISSNHVFILSKQLGIEEHSEMRAMGGLWVTAAKLGYVRKTQTMPQTEKGIKGVCHCGPKQLWDSLIFQDLDFNIP